MAECERRPIRRILRITGTIAPVNRNQTEIVIAVVALQLHRIGRSNGCCGVATHKTECRKGVRFHNLKIPRHRITFERVIGIINTDRENLLSEL